jgi:hypothetical protein
MFFQIFAYALRPMFIKPDLVPLDFWVLCNFFAPRFWHWISMTRKTCLGRSESSHNSVTILLMYGSSWSWISYKLWMLQPLQCDVVVKCVIIPILALFQVAKFPLVSRDGWIWHIWIIRMSPRLLGDGCTLHKTNIDEALRWTWCHRIECKTSKRNHGGFNHIVFSTKEIGLYSPQSGTFCWGGSNTNHH